MKQASTKPEPELMISIVREQANDLKNPPQTTFEVLKRLELFAPNFVKLMQAKLE